MTGLLEFHDLDAFPLPVAWDAHPITWQLSPLPVSMFICPPPKPEACSRCRRVAPTTAYRGLVHPLPGESWPGPVIRTAWRTGVQVPVHEQVPAQPLYDLWLWRCSSCGLDVVWQASTELLWDLGPEDYGPDGSVAPGSAA